MSHAIIAFAQSNAADLLSAYLNTQGIESTVEFSNQIQASSRVPDSDEASDPNKVSGYQVCIAQYEDIPQASRIAKDFVNNPNQPKFQASAWELGELSHQASPNENSQNVVLALYEFKRSPFTFIVLALCLLVFIISFLGYLPAMGQLLEIKPMSELLQTHQWWRLVGPNFLHFSFMHLAFNLVWWWMLGRQLELSFGTSSLIIFFFIASLFSNISQLMVSGPNFGGLSGIVYALVGFVWWIGWLRPKWLISLPNNVIYFLLAWLVIGYFDVLWVNMANEAHTFGLVSGCLMALIVHLLSSKKR